MSDETNGTRALIGITGDGVRLTVSRDAATVVDGVALGFSLGGLRLGVAPEQVSATERVVRDRFTLHSGKATGPHDYEHRETVHTFREEGVVWQAIVRTGPHGAAVRYALPLLDGTAEITADHTTVPLPAGSRNWVLDYQTWYETPRYGVDTADLEEGAYGLPFLTRLDPAVHLLITESGIDGRFAGAHLRWDGALRFTLADAGVEVTRGLVTPWRVFLVGSLAELVSSLFVEELAPAAAPELEAADWVRPGRASWSWWSDFYSGAQLDKQKHFVDVAADLGWEHLLIDCGWEETWVPEIVAYASLRGVQVHLWTIWRDLNSPEDLRRLALWRSWGVAGIKVDFMESESKDRYRWYDTILTESARLGLMVNFHGSVIPRGWARTFPQVIGYEAVRGAEYYVFFENQALTASHNVIQPFTRNVVGAMDATPVAFGAAGRTTGDGHELGLAVAFECGITHFADHVDAYASRPAAARFLAELAPAWDETVLLAGDPDTHAVIARRAGDRWFVGGVATGEARTIHVPLDAVAGRDAQVWIVGDDLTETKATGSFDVPVARDGGFAAIVAPAGTEVFRARSRPRLTPPEAVPIAELDADGTTTITTGPADRLRPPPGWTAERRTGAEWLVRARGLLPGRLGVVTVERDGDGVVPVVAHTRVFHPLTEGEHALSDLPMTAFVNADGPVERDMSNGGGNPRDGGPLRVAGREFARGLGTAPPSEARFHLGGRAARLTGAVGVDDESAGRASVAVLADGREIFTADVAAGQPVVPFDLDVSGVRTLVLRGLEGGSAHVDWVDAIVHVHQPPSTN